MVKGISKRVVVVRFPDTRVFEQAIFIVRDDASARPGVSAGQILDEACRVADSYIRKGASKVRKRLPPVAFLLMGAASVGAAWLLTFLL